MIRYAIIAGAISLGIAPVFLFASPPIDLNCYLVQMHIHAHTNHNGNDLPASMEWHCAQAEAHGFDVIWWSEHSEVFDTFDDIRVSFRNASFEEAAGFIDLGLTRARRRLSRLNLEVPTEGWTADVVDGRLEASVTFGGCCFADVKLTPASERGTVRSVSWARPVASGLRVEVDMDVRGLGEDSYLTFGFDLAAHPDGQHHLVFDIVPGDPSEPIVVGDTLVTLEVGVEDFPARLGFDLEEAAAYLPDGGDNTLSSLFIEFGARKGATIEVALDSLILISGKPAGENQHRVISELLDEYVARYGMTQYMGVEASGIHTPERPHMNAFFPESTETLANLVIDPAVERTEWAAGVGRRGGIVSLNHPFGAALSPSARGVDAYDNSIPLLELASGVGPIPEEDLWDVARPIIETGGLGCRILEVGYIFRGTGSLADHLRLWDLVLAHGVRMVGSGVSDAHGGLWGPDLRPNPFASWIWAEGVDRSSLLKALGAGRVCFGDPFLFKSKLAFGVDGAFMGDTLRVERGAEPAGWIRITPWVDDLDVRLVLVKIEAGREPVYIRRDRLSEPRGGFKILVEEACFARIEVYGKDGGPLVFSNPVWLMPEDAGN
jgi:hypothetical protein